MYTDIIEMRTFYHSPLGERAAHALAMAISRVWEPLPNERLLGLGYARPWLDRLEPDTERTLCFMLAAQGAIKWPRTGPSRTALVFDEELPLGDASIDRILAVHHLENAENPRETLMELWRVLAPNGRLVLVVPNRRGVWARVETTPFGTGRPFSRGQVTALLREANFTPGDSSDALFFPPLQKRSALRFATTLERAGRRIWPVFSGVIVIEAQKRLYQGRPVTQRSSRRVFMPVGSPQGASRQADGVSLDKSPRA